MTHTNKISIHHFLVNKWCGNLKLVYQGTWNTNTELLQSYQHLEEIRIVHNRSLRESPHQSILPYKQDRKSTSHIENPRLLPERVLTNQSCHTNKIEIYFTHSESTIVTRESPRQSILPYKQDRKSTSHIENPRLLPERVLTNQSCHTNKIQNLLHTLRIHDCYPRQSSPINLAIQTRQKIYFTHWESTIVTWRKKFPHFI